MAKFARILKAQRTTRLGFFLQKHQPELALNFIGLD